MQTKTALITGASAGIGREAAIALSSLGYQLILVARRFEKLTELSETLSTPCHLIACDVTDHGALTSALSACPAPFKKIDVLINNAGLALGLATADKTDWQDWQTMIETNCLALAFLTRQILPGMVERNQGMIINLGSTAGSYAYKGGNVYGASKAFVDQFSSNLRTDLLGTKIRVTNLIPGLISGTEFSKVRFHGDTDAAESVYADCDALTSQDIANTIKWVVSQPEHININRIEIMPTCQAPAGLAVDKTMK